MIVPLSCYIFYENYPICSFKLYSLQLVIHGLNQTNKVSANDFTKLLIIDIYLAGARKEGRPKV